MTIPPLVAHLVTTGLGPIYDGISHLLVSTAGRRALFALPPAWLIGGATGYAMGAPVLADGVAACSSLVVGALVAASPRLSPATVTGLACVIGLLHGWLNGAAIAGAQRDVLGLAGIAGTTFVLVALVAALVVSLRSATARIVLRVAGSWIAAIGLLMLGWSLRGR
jgi:urease accessory protein